MVDLETLSTRCHAAIAVLAAVKFDRHEEDKEYESKHSFHALIDLQSCKNVGLDVDNKTIEWWNKQDPTIKKEIFEGERKPLREVLENFGKWFYGSEKVWSQGASFDIPILEEAMKRSGISIPWKFFNVRDTRTMYDLAGMKSKDLPTGDLHHALEDCKRQVWGVQEAYRRLKNNSLKRKNNQDENKGNERQDRNSTFKCRRLNQQTKK